MKKLVVLAFVTAGLTFLSELQARAGVSFAFGFPISIPSIEGPVVYDLYPYYNYLPGYVYFGGYYGPYWGSRYYYGRGYGGNGPFHFRYYGHGYYGGGYHGNGRH
jgi:hypothetical protein